MSSIFSSNTISTSLIEESLRQKQAKNIQNNAFSKILFENLAQKTNDISAKNSSLSWLSNSLALQNNTLNLKFRQNNFHFAYKYFVDSEGFMGEDFNEAAGIAKDFKIHSSSLKELENYLENNINAAGIKADLGLDRYYEHIDMPHLFGTYYTLFSDFLSKSLKNKDFFSAEDLASLPKAYSGEGGIFKADADKNGFIFEGKNMPYARDRSDELITHFYDEAELLELENIQKNLAWTGLGIKIIKLDFTEQALQKNTEAEYESQKFPDGSSYIFKKAFNPDISVYQNDKGISKQALFMAFMKAQLQQTPQIDGGETLINSKAHLYERVLLKQSRASVFIDISQKNQFNLQELLKKNIEEAFLSQIDDFYKKTRIENYKERLT